MEAGFRRHEVFVVSTCVGFEVKCLDERVDDLARSFELTARAAVGGYLGGRRSRSRFGHSFANSKSNELPPIVDIQLSHDGFTVAIHSLGAATECFCDAGPRHTSADHSEDLSLPGREQL